MNLLKDAGDSDEVIWFYLPEIFYDGVEALRVADTASRIEGQVISAETLHRVGQGEETDVPFKLAYISYVLNQHFQCSDIIIMCEDDAFRVARRPARVDDAHAVLTVDFFG